VPAVTSNTFGENGFALRVRAMHQRCGRMAPGSGPSQEVVTQRHRVHGSCAVRRLVGHQHVHHSHDETLKASTTALGRRVVTLTLGESLSATTETRYFPRMPLAHFDNGAASQRNSAPALGPCPAGTLLTDHAGSCCSSPGEV